MHKICSCSLIGNGKSVCNFPDTELLIRVLKHIPENLSLTFRQIWQGSDTDLYGTHSFLFAVQMLGEFFPRFLDAVELYLIK